MSAFPHLLVASEFPPNSSGGGPAVVRQMLKDWPAEKLSWWSCFPDRNKSFGRNVTAHRVADLPARLYPQRRWPRQKSWLLEKIWCGHAARHLRATLDELKPEAVWAIPHAWSIPALVAVLPEAGGGFHVTMQDYVDTAAHVKQYGRGRSLRMTALQDRLYASATTRDATSHPMIADLRQRTGAAAAQMLHAGLEQSDFAWLAQSPPPRGPEIRIAYAGTILVEKEFELFIRALETIRKKIPTPVTVEFFGNHVHAGRPWFDPAWMREHGNLPEPALTHALRECSWGFAPMSLTDGDPRYNKFSFPTKFISYLAAGLPVITLGHPDCSVVKMARQYDVGICCTEILETELLTRLPQQTAAHRPEILRCATTEFDASRMRSTLRNCFNECSKASQARRTRR